MAPTLLGAHMRFTCDDCGYHFDANYSDPSSGDETRIPQPVDRAPIASSAPTAASSCRKTTRTMPGNGTQKPPVHYGDRILVLKYLYLFEEPQRWDVVVFKSPDEPDKWPLRAELHQASDRPAERIGADPRRRHLRRPAEAGAARVYRPDQAALRAGCAVAGDLRQRLRPAETVARQRLEVAAAVDRARAAAAGRSARRRRRTGAVLRFDNAAGESTVSFDPSVNPIALSPGSDARSYAFTDWLAYDIDTDLDANVVHDLKLSFVYNRAAGDGPLRAKITRGGDGTMSSSPSSPPATPASSIATRPASA